MPVPNWRILTAYAITLPTAAIVSYLVANRASPKIREVRAPAGAEEAAAMADENCDVAQASHEQVKAAVTVLAAANKSSASAERFGDLTQDPFYRAASASPALGRLKMRLLSQIGARISTACPAPADDQDVFTQLRVAFHVRASPTHMTAGAGDIRVARGAPLEPERLTCLRRALSAPFEVVDGPMPTAAAPPVYDGPASIPVSFGRGGS